MTETKSQKCAGILCCAAKPVCLTRISVLFAWQASTAPDRAGHSATAEHSFSMSPQPVGAEGVGPGLGRTASVLSTGADEVLATPGGSSPTEGTQKISPWQARVEQNLAAADHAGVAPKHIEMFARHDQQLQLARLDLSGSTSSLVPSPALPAAGDGHTHVNLAAALDGLNTELARMHNDRLAGAAFGATGMSRRCCHGPWVRS
eukprot:SAG25_NODE_565_length_6897_cov_2.639453_4_plen_204_part_00